jgi:hypothetical protein
LLKERGAEKSGYRGCLIGSLIGGGIGGYLGYSWSLTASNDVHGMASKMFGVMYGSIGFTVGTITGLSLVWFVDLFTRKREKDIDEF